jgi:hypothetical protein
VGLSYPSADDCRRRHYDAGVPERPEPQNPSVVLVAAGAVATVGGGAVAAYRVSEHLPMVGGLLRRGRVELAKRGEVAIVRGAEPLRILVSAVAADVVQLVLQELDMTGAMREKVDIGRLKESTDKVTADVMSEIRTQSERADQVVSGLVDRMMGPDRKNR